MTFLASLKGPLGLKASKPEAKGLTRARAMKTQPKQSRREKRGDVDLDYLRAVRELPCCICVAWGLNQITRTEAHHPICLRHSQDKVPDREAIPLCDGHHEGERDTTKIAIHRDRAEWEGRYGSDRDFIAPTQDAVSGQLTRG